jgi:Acetyltransferase (GNAT) domain
MKLHRLEPSQVDWDRLDRFEDRTVFQTQEWLRFISVTQHAEPVVAELRDDRLTAGYFSGLIIRKAGLRILGSSFPGWTTPYIGFNLAPGTERWQALAALQEFAFGPLRCVHLEVSDPGFVPDDGARLGFVVDAYDSYETDLTRTEDELFGAMTSACRRCIRKAEKTGVRIEEAADAAFAAEYFDQLTDVFAKQSLSPTYDRRRVEALVAQLLPTGRLLLLRARDPEGRSIGTGIYPGFNRVAEFWGNASYRTHQHLRPNESLHWYAMRYWKAQGIRIFDWGGGGEYKEKYGVRPRSVPWFRKSRYPWLDYLRRTAKQTFAWRQRLAGRMKPRGGARVPVDGASPEDAD